MSTKMFKEGFTGKYDGVNSPILLPQGAICDGKNIRKVGTTGGWKPRKGSLLHHTTTLGAFDIDSLHVYKHPRLDDYHFIAQANSNLYEATHDPLRTPGAAEAFGSSILSGIGTTPGFSCMVKEHWFFGDGSGAPVVYGGDTPYCSGMVCWLDTDGGTYVDYTRDVTDARDSTYCVLRNDADDVYYVGSHEIAEGIVLDIGSTVNAVAATATVSSWQSGAWSDRSATDGTADSGATHAQDGSLIWTRSANDTMSVIAGKMLYWYRVSFNAALTNDTQIKSVKLIVDASRMTNKWSGVYEYVAGARFYDESAGEYVDVSGKVTNESTSQYLQMDAATTSDRLYIKSIEPLTGIGLATAAEYENTALANFSQIDCWDGSAWTSVGTLTDETTNVAGTISLAQTGVIWFNGTAVTAKRRTFDWDMTPGYWYRLQWDLAFDNADDDIRLYFVSVATFPSTLASVKGCVEFKNRLFTWGDPEYPNRLGYSAKDKPDCHSGSDSGYTDQFGDMEEIFCAIPFYNELIVFKKNSIWLLEGYMPANFGTLKIADTIGLASPKSAVVIETGYPGMHADEPLSIALWQDTDGIYVIDGRKPRKISAPIDQFFNPEYSDCIPAASIENRQAFMDKNNNEYHFLLPDKELVYNYITDEWYPPWERTIDLTCGVSLRATNNRFYTYGGVGSGFVIRLETGTSDENASGTGILIDHFLKTRAISAKQGTSITLRFAFRKLWLEGKGQTNATALTTTFYQDLESSGTVLATPAVLDLIASGKDLIVPGVDVSKENCNCFQIKFDSSVINREMEIWSFLYLLDVRGEIDFE